MYVSYTGDLYRAAGNLYARLAHEMKQQKELVELVEQAREVGQLTFNFTPAQKKALERLRMVVQTLEASLLRVDDMIALFNDY